VTLVRLLATTLRAITPIQLGVMAATTLLSAQPVPAGAAGAGFGLRPAHSDPDDPATLAYFKPALGPGTTFSDQVVVSNSGTNDLTFYVDPVEGLTGANTGSVYANRGDPVGGAGGWISVAARRVTVGAGKQMLAGFTVQVPGNATPGDHLAGIAFEDTATQTTEGRFGITEVVRAVIGVLVRVAGPAAPFDLRISNVGLQSPALGQTRSRAVMQLHNRGQLLGKPYLALSITGLGGYQREMELQLDTVLPGPPTPLSLPWGDQLSPGRYRVCVGWSASGPPAKPSTCTYTSLAPRPPPTAPPLGPVLLPVAPLPIWTVVLLFGAGLSVGVAAALMGSRWWRNRRRRREPSDVPD
jgi:hypothetical protein